ncbi:NAD-dependent epimerase/dehydratase family protein [Thermicanus aegyptius]|uniref:NAD-dependent epimerase/dehydratase family protein n=1 Tax=Thermicanus aegyptius TaxID=94009 RepID=UPI00040F3149|nr:NAD-dependent epimerase/dehydratase family protein [Thermicanus aegyptius]
MRILITGGAGFIGSHIAQACVEKGFETYIFDDLSTGREENLFPEAHFIKGDLADAPLEDLLADIQPDYLIHEAAQASVPVSTKDPCRDAEINILGTVRLLEAAKKSNVKKVVYASSAAVYGNPVRLPIDESHPQHPLSFYGVSKYVPEFYLDLYWKHFGLPYTVLRYANVYGPRQVAHGEGGVVAIFADKIKRGEKLSVYGDGDQTRDFIYVSDVVAANLAALERGTGEIFNIGTGIPTSVNQLIKAFEEILGHPVEKEYLPPREGDIRDSLFHINKAVKELAWSPKVSLAEGLRRTLSS